jgi:hypothetical protein
LLFENLQIFEHVCLNLTYFLQIFWPMPLLLFYNTQTVPINIYFCRPLTQVHNGKPVLGSGGFLALAIWVAPRTILQCFSSIFLQFLGLFRISNQKTFFPRLPLDTETRILHLSGIWWMFFHLFVLLSGNILPDIVDS